MEQAFFKKITQFYEQLESDLIQVEENVCKACQCSECCSIVAKGGEHSVSSMELDYIENYYQETGYPQGNINLFKEYLSRKKDTAGEILHPICPFFSKQNFQCSIYSARPLSCRLFGSYFIEGFQVPSRCYFNTIGKIVKKDEFIKEIPFAVAFSELKAEHLGAQKITLPLSPELHQNPEYLSFFDSSDPYLKGRRNLQDGKITKALEHYQETIVKNPKQSFIPCCISLDLIQAQQYAEAAAYGEKAVTLSPENAFYHFVLAIAYQLSGKIEKAIESYQESLKLNPENEAAKTTLNSLLQSS